MDRPALALDENTPGSDVTAETAAALAAAAVLFKDDADYSNLCLSHAMDLFEFAELYRGEYDENEAFATARQFHPSSEFGDELAWAALWLYYATGKRRIVILPIKSLNSKPLKGNNQYLTRAEDYIAEFGLDLSAPTEFSADDKTIAVMVYHALLTSDQSAAGVQMIIDFCTSFQSQYNADGYLRMTDWHNFGATSGVAYICLYAANHVVSGQTEADFVDFSKSLIIDVLGAGEQSYMTGYGHNPPTRAHHRDSACPIGKDCGWGMFEDKYTPNEFTLEGAIMGGPDATSGFWEDNRKDYTRNEPSLVANALFQATVAGIRERELYDEYPSQMILNSDPSGISLPTEDFSDFFSSWPFPPGTNVVDYCNDKTCENDGICISDYTNYTFTCDCQDGYFGTRCDTITEPVVDFIRQWGHGGEIKLNLPSERPLGAWQVLLEFPPGCALQSLDIWHGCMDPYASSLSNSTFYVYQVGWHHDHQNIGIVFETDQTYDENSYWGNSASCFDESAYSLTLVARGSHEADNIEGMTLQWSTDPDKCPGELPWNSPSTDPAYPENIILGGDEVIDQAFLDLMVNNYDGPGHVNGSLEVEWVSVGEEVGWMRIWLPDAMPPAENPWQLQIAFAEGCNVQTVLTYQACINTVNSDLNTEANATNPYGENVANLLLYQNGTDLGTDFIGLRIKFPQADQMTCLDANSYVFNLYEWNNPIEASSLLDTCEIMYPDRDTQLALLGDSGAVYVPESSVPSMDFLSGPLSWTQGANGHFYLPNPKPMAPFGLQVQVPAGCNIQRINFWHACVVLANSNINSGYFELEQIGWQEEHGYIGFSVDFQPSQYSSDIPASCKDANLYTLTLEDRSLDPQMGISWNGFYNDYADNCPQALGEALPYSSYEVQLRDGAVMRTSLSNQMMSRLGNDPFAGNAAGTGAATSNPGERPIYYSDRVSDGQLSQYQQASIATWAKRYDAEAKEEKMREAERQAAKLAFQIENGLIDAPRQIQQNLQQSRNAGYNAGSGGLMSGGIESSSLPSSSIPVQFETRSMDATSVELFWQHPAGKRERYKIEYKDWIYTVLQPCYITKRC
ncbi:unnamed protein product [Oikopleura dioica]|uniref:Endoglucanase n=1 Tax=Oikopleura dioica TaxID=34765 RepID=E4YK07_OIKDI|nr:unnamed protein product [Oikopleura dioica]